MKRIEVIGRIQRGPAWIADTIAIPRKSVLLSQVRAVVLLICSAIALVSSTPPAAADSTTPPISVVMTPGTTTTTTNTRVTQSSRVQDIDTVDTSGGSQLDDDLISSAEVDGGGMTVHYNPATFFQDWTDNQGWRYVIVYYELESASTGTFNVTQTNDDYPELVDDTIATTVYSVQVN